MVVGVKTVGGIWALPIYTQHVEAGQELSG